MKYMHEWALAEAVVESIRKVVEEKGARGVFVVKVGELQQIDMDIFNFALKELLREYVRENVTVKVEVEEAFLKCRNCGYEWKFKDTLGKMGTDEREAVHFFPELAHAFISCPRCSSRDFEIVRGRGVWLELRGE